jgi:hypothetical protein
MKNFEQEIVVLNNQGVAKPEISDIKGFRICVAPVYYLILLHEYL